MYIYESTFTNASLRTHIAEDHVTKAPCCGGTQPFEHLYEGIHEHHLDVTTGVSSLGCLHLGVITLVASSAKTQTLYLYANREKDRDSLYIVYLQFFNSHLYFVFLLAIIYIHIYIYTYVYICIYTKTRLQTHLYGRTFPKTTLRKVSNQLGRTLSSFCLGEYLSRKVDV